MWVWVWAHTGTVINHRSVGYFMYHKLPLPLVYFSWKPQFFYFCRGTVARMQNFNVQKIASLAPIAHFFTFLLETGVGASVGRMGGGRRDLTTPRRRSALARGEGIRAALCFALKLSLS